MAKAKEKAHALCSASGAARWLECTPSAVAATLYPETDTAFTREGTLAHGVAEMYARGDITAPGGEITQEMIDCASGYRDYVSELKKDPDAVVLLEQRVDISPWVPGGFGTVDCLLIQGDLLTIVDYKYGVGVPVSAVGNPQMRLYALGALHEFGFVYDVARVEMHIYQPRIDNISADALSVDELLAWGEEVVKPRAALAAEGKGDYVPGAHCKFCPHAGKCRALTDVCTQKATAHGLRAKVPVLAPFEVAEVLRLEPLVSLWLKRVKEQALTDLLNGADVPGYKVVEGKLGNRKWTAEFAVAEALDAAGVAREDYTVTSLLSPSAMDKLLGKKRAAELLSDFVIREPGTPTVVPETDKREAICHLAEAQEDFKL